MCPSFQPSNIPSSQLVHVVTSLAPGGLERLVAGLARERNRRCGGSTRICCLDEPGEQAAALGQEVVTVLGARRDRFPWDGAAVRRLRDVVAGQRDERGFRVQGSGLNPIASEQDSDSSIQHPPFSIVLHAHNMAAWQYAALARRGTAARLVYTQHGPNPHNQGWKDRLRGHVLAGLTDRLVAVSGHTADEMARSYWIRRERIRVIRNGVDVRRQKMQPPMNPEAEMLPGVASRFRAGADERRYSRAQLGVPEEAFVVGSAGRLSAEKNYLLLLEAFKVFHGKHGESVLVLVGDGAEKERIASAVRDAGLERCVRMPGMQSDIGPWLRVMDVFCLSSLSEGISVSLLEAGAISIPAVVTRVGGNAEVVEDGITGLIVPSGDAGALAGALESLHGGESLRRQMGVNARARVEKFFSLDRTLEAYEEEYGGAGEESKVTRLRAEATPWHAG